MEKIKVKVLISATREKVWNYYTESRHITGWNFADPSWHCPFASNELKVGGRYVARMEARDGSYGIDFEAIYTEIVTGERFIYEFGGRFAEVVFSIKNETTDLMIIFDPESENPVELQKACWQAILNNIKNYVETH